MLLSDVFEILTYGELAQLHLGGGGEDEVGIDPVNYPKIIRNVNMGLIELHKRFPIKQNEVNIQLYSHITDYILHSDYAESNTASTKPYKYIMDATMLEPFDDDILLIRHVYDEVGDEFSLNDLNDTTSLYTPQHNILQVPYPDNENTLAVIYRAGPKKINHVGFSEPENTELELPDQYLEALTAYVAYRLFASVNLGEGNAEANSYYAKFETAVAVIKDVGLYIADTNQNTKFGDGEWP